MPITEQTKGDFRKRIREVTSKANNIIQNADHISDRFNTLLATAPSAEQDASFRALQEELLDLEAKIR